MEDKTNPVECKYKKCNESVLRISKVCGWYGERWKCELTNEKLVETEFAKKQRSSNRHILQDI